MTLQSGKQSRTSLLLQVPCVCAGARVCYASSNICVATQQRAGRPTEAQTSFCRREARQLSSRAAFRFTSKCTHTRALAQAQEARSGNALMNPEWCYCILPVFLGPVWKDTTQIACSSSPSGFWPVLRLLPSPPTRLRFLWILRMWSIFMKRRTTDWLYSCWVVVVIFFLGG